MNNPATSPISNNTDNIGNTSNTVRVKDIIAWAENEGMPFEYKGSKELEITGFSSLSNCKHGSITWIKKQKNIPTDTSILGSISCVVLQEGIDTSATSSLNNCFIAKNSKEFFFGVLSRFFSTGKNIAERVGSYIGPNVILGEGVVIGCNCTLDGKITIGAGTVLEHNVTIINAVIIGKDCLIHSGTVIGKDGFGFSFDKNNIPTKVQHFGGVRIGNRVEIGANCNIDRGTIDDTVIGDDVKIDSLSVIAHNVQVGAGAMIIGAMLSGSSKIGEKSYLAPRCIVKNQVTVGDNSFIGMGAVVTKDVGDNCMVISVCKMQTMAVEDYREWL